MTAEQEKQVQKALQTIFDGISKQIGENSPLLNEVMTVTDSLNIEILI
jgi:hypothetical protein